MSAPDAPRDDDGWERVRAVPLLVGIALLVALGFLLLLLRATDGHFVPPVVDLYLICQYAKAMAEGHPFHYNAGEAASSGATSLLHTSLLAAAHAAGARGEGLVAFAVAAGAACYVASVLVAARIGRTVSGARVGLLAGLLVALSGPVAWGFLYGSDVALYMLLALLLLDRMIADWRSGRPAGIAVVGSLLALARPEALALGVLIGVWWTGLARRAAGGVWRAVVWAPTAAGLAVLALNRAVTGLWLGTSVADKSLFASYGLADGLGIVSQYLTDVVRGLLLGFYPPDAAIGFAKGWAPAYFPPLALLLVAAALVGPIGDSRPALRAWCGMVAILFVLLAPNMFVGVHFNRYLMWAFPGLLVATAIGLATATRLLAREDEALERTLFTAAAVVMIALGVLSVVRFASLYATMAGGVYRRDVAAAEWIERSLPRGVAMANAATSVEYLTGHRNMNLHGVTSPFFFGNTPAERDAGMLESLARVPASERPPYLISSQAAQEQSVTLREIAPGPPLFETLSFSDEILVLRTRYDLVGSNARFFTERARRAVTGLREVDRLNTCDARDEAAHRYSYRSGLGDLSLHGTVRVDAYAPADGAARVIDGGRAILGEERFLVATHASRDLVIVMRTADSVEGHVVRSDGSGTLRLAFPAAGMTIRAGDAAPIRFTYQPGPGWDEQVARIPASAVSEGATPLVLTGRYPSFYYWFFQ